MADFKINWHRSINFGDQLNPYIINHFLGFYPEVLFNKILPGVVNMY